MVAYVVRGKYNGVTNDVAIQIQINNVMPLNQ